VSISAAPRSSYRTKRREPRNQEERTKRAQVVEQSDAKGVVRIGSIVVVRDEFGESLVDRRAGDTVTFTTPGGVRHATLVSVGSTP
jgi:transcription elongation GreA/GreB family factor